MIFNAIESKKNLVLKPLAAAISLLLSASTHAASLHITLGDTRTLNDAYSFTEFYQSGGTLTGSGAVSIDGSSIWLGGTQQGSGVTNANGGLTISGNDAKTLYERTLNNNGAVNWSSGSAGMGNIYTGGGATINNNGEWRDQNAFDNTITNAYGGAASKFNNAGTYTKSGDATTSIGIAFNNSGVVNVDAGTLHLYGGGVSQSGSRFDGAGTLKFGVGNHTLAAGSSINTGSVEFKAGTINIDGAYNVGHSTTVSGGTANFNGTVANNGGTLTVSGGEANFNTGAVVEVATLNQSAGKIGGSQTMTVTGAAAWLGGTQQGSGVTNANGGLTISGNDAKTLYERTLNNNGAANWSSGSAGMGNIYTGGGATINNNGEWRDQNAFDNTITNAYGGAASKFNNAGTYTKSGDATTSIGIAFNNTGVVNVDAGTLNLHGGGVSQSGSRFDGAGTLKFGGGNHTLAAGSSINTGSVEFKAGTANIDGAYNVGHSTTVSGGTANFNGTVTNNGGTLAVSGGEANFYTGAVIEVAALNQSAGKIGGAQTLTVTGATAWLGGTQQGSGVTNANGGLTIGGNDLKTLYERTLNNNGAASWSNGGAERGSIYTGGGATINNNGEWRDQNAFDNTITNAYGGAASKFNNAGTYTKSGDATTSIDIAFNNSGVVNVDAGVMKLSAQLNNQGKINVADGATVNVQNSIFNNQGSLQGNGIYQTRNATTALVNAGVIAPGINGIGALTIAGDFTQTDSGFLDIELSSLTSFDTLHVLGDVNLSGTLRINSLNEFNPMAGASFTIATFDDGLADFSDIGGTFKNIVWSGFRPDVAFDVAYLDHALVLTASAAPVPVPGAVWLFGSGLLGLIGIRRR